MPIKQCFSWWCFENRGVSDAELLREAKLIGFDGVELIPEHLMGMAQDSGLEVVTMTGHASIESGLNDPAQFNRIQQEIDASLEVATQYGIKKLIVFSGSKRAGVSVSESRDTVCEGLRCLSVAAQSAGVTLIVELLNSKRDHPGYEADSTEFGVSVCQAVNSPVVKLLYDIYHMQVMEGDLITNMNLARPYIAHYHTAGNPGRGEIDDAQEIQYSGVFRSIAASGYSDYIGHEFIPRGGTLDGLRSAYALCNGNT